MWDVQHACLCCIFRKDPRQCGHGCWKYPTSSICSLLWILNGLWGLCPLLTLIELPSLIKFGKEWWHPQWGLRTCCRLMNCSWSGRSKPYPLLSVSNIKVVCMLSLLWSRSCDKISSNYLLCNFIGFSNSRRDPSKVVLSLQTLPPRADTESDRRCGTEWGWLAKQNYHVQFQKGWSHETDNRKYLK